MNCPLCSEPMLFGATSCPCGYSLGSAASEDVPIELSYWEALRAFWRIYWPTQLVSSVLIFALAFAAALTQPRGARPSELAVILSGAVQIAIGAAAYFLFVPRVCSRPYGGFALVLVSFPSGEITTRMRGRVRIQVWFFLWWRLIVAGLLAGVMAMPLNAILGIMGVHCSPWIAIFAVILGVGPILLKMLIGQQFKEFRLEARRSVDKAISAGIGQESAIPVEADVPAPRTRHD